MEPRGLVCNKNFKNAGKMKFPKVSINRNIFILQVITGLSLKREGTLANLENPKSSVLAIAIHG